MTYQFFVSHTICFEAIRIKDSILVDSTMRKGFMIISLMLGMVSDAAGLHLRLDLGGCVNYVKNQCSTTFGDANDAQKKTAKTCKDAGSRIDLFD